MRITITEPGGVKHDGQHYHEGDSVTVPDGLGRMFLELGWCRHLPEEGETEVEAGVRKPGAVELDIDNLTIASSSS